MELIHIYKSDDIKFVFCAYMPLFLSLSTGLCSHHTSSVSGLNVMESSLKPPDDTSPAVPSIPHLPP